MTHSSLQAKGLASGALASVDTGGAGSQRIVTVVAMHVGVAAVVAMWGAGVNQGLAVGVGVVVIGGGLLAGQVMRRGGAERELARLQRLPWEMNLASYLEQLEGREYAMVAAVRVTFEFPVSSELERDLHGEAVALFNADRVEVDDRVATIYSESIATHKDVRSEDTQGRMETETYYINDDVHAWVTGCLHEVVLPFYETNAVTRVDVTLE